MSRIVVGYDGSDGSRAALDSAIGLARELGDTVTAVFGYAVPVSFGGEIASHEEAVRERGEKMLAGADQQAEGAGFEIETKLVRSRAVDALLSEGANARMVVVGNHGGEPPLRGALLGSATLKLVHLSEVPVLVVPA